MRGTNAEGALGHGTLPDRHCCIGPAHRGSCDGSSDHRWGLGQISARKSDTETGFVYGIGLENKLNERVSLRLEYLGFGNFDSVGDFGIVRAGVNFKFGP